MESFNLLATLNQIFMKNKACLAFEMLEMEFEKINTDKHIEFIGGMGNGQQLHPE